ncbi:MAG: DEAD/DEAH box helicase [Gammaproteobacteria bacterium]|nr:DEAD/DEAH box helicase [Gammaproteobacteria bacterium]
MTQALFPDVTQEQRTISPAAELFLQVLAIAYPETMGSEQAWNVARTAFANHEPSPRFNLANFRQAKGELIAQGLAQRKGKTRALIDLSACIPATLGAKESGNLARFLAHPFTKNHTGPLGYDIGIERRLRNLLVAGEFDQADELATRAHQFRFLAYPGGIELLPTFPERYRAAGVEALLATSIEIGIDPDLALQAWRDHAAEPTDHIDEAAFLHVLRGQFDQALALFDKPPSDALGQKFWTTAHASTQALVAMLRGDDEAATKYIETALAAERAGTRKRNVYPPHRAISLALVAWVRSHDLAPQGELERVLRTGQKLARDPDLHRLLGLAAEQRLQAVHRSVDWFGHTAMGLMGKCLSSLWQAQALAGDAYVLPLDWQAETELLLEVGRRHGHRWIEAEAREMLARSGVSEDNHEASAQHLHHALGTITLADAARPLPAWHHSLAALEEMAAKSRSSKTGPRANAGQRRLVWEVQTSHMPSAPHSRPSVWYEHEDVPILSCREQKATRGGKWTKGRLVDRYRLAVQARGMDFLSEQDRTAIAALGNLQGGIEDAAWAAVHALVGHPHVESDGKAVQVVEREPELIVEEAGEGGAILRMNPHPGPTNRFTGSVPSDTRIEVTRFTDSQRKLCDIVPEGGLELPAAVRSRFLTAIAALAAEVRVQSAGDEAVAAREVPADPEPWLRLVPNGSGLIADMLVAPVPGSDVYLAPGTGGSTVFAVEDGETVQARRNLAAEREAARRVIDACPSLHGIDAGESGNWTMELDAPAACLELVEQLGAAGARCLWPDGEAFRIVAGATAGSLNLTVKSAEQWFTASGELRINDEEAVGLRELFRLLDESPGSRFLKLGEQGFLALTNSFRRQLDDLRSLSTSSGKNVRFHPLTALAFDDLLDGASVEADAAWDQQRQRMSEAQAFEPELPSTLQAELRPYQRDGYHWLARLGHWGAGACLADDMGLGKTVQALALLLQLAPEGPALVVCPTSVVANWQGEARRFAPTLNVIPYVGDAAGRGERLKDVGPFDLVLTTYGLLQNDIERIAEVDWRAAVLDEAQAIKNAATKRARAARAIPASFRLITTGTPIQNNLMDLYSLFGFINPGLLGSLAHYRESFALPIERDNDAEARARLRRLIAPFMLRRLKTDVLDDLPERTEITLHVEMSAEEASFYEALRQRAMEDLGGESLDQPGAARLKVLAHLTRLRLACCDPRLVREQGAPASSKLAAFREVLLELRENRHKVLVFSQFVRHLKRIEEVVQELGIPYQYLDGSTPAKARAQRTAAFQAGEGDVFLISLKAGGTGLNLTAADYVIHMDPWWNPAVEDQASDRAHRIGQTRPVTIYRLVAKGTIEDQIVELHHHKKDLADRLLQDADAPGRLRAEELLQLLREPLA